MRRRRLFARTHRAGGARRCSSAALATLQYRWLGQVSEAERDRSARRRSIAARASSPTSSIARSAASFTATPAGTPDRARCGDVRRRGTTTGRRARDSPSSIKGIYLASDAERTTTSLLRFDPARRAFEPIDWPASLEPVARASAAGARLGVGRRRSRNRGTVFTWSTPPPICADVPAVVIGVPATIENRETAASTAANVSRSARRQRLRRVRTRISGSSSSSSIARLASNRRCCRRWRSGTFRTRDRSLSRRGRRLTRRRAASRAGSPTVSVSIPSTRTW